MRRIGSLTSNKFVYPAAAVFLSLVFLFSFTAQAHRLALSAPAALTIWAWERDEDLSFIDPAKVSVAYFAGTIYVKGSSVRFRPRTQKLIVPKGTHSFPVLRIESIRSSIHAPGTKAFSLTGCEIPTMQAAGYVAKTIAIQMDKLKQSNSGLNSLSGSGSNFARTAVQIDFDALEDERPFYKQMLRNLKHEIPCDTKISITSLASWLLADKWLERGCADEAVAMLFSIGPGKREVLSLLKKQSLNSGAGIPIAVGISANEPATNQALFQSNIQNKTGNLYLFSSRPWTQSRLRSITSEALAQ